MFEVLITAALLVLAAWFLHRGWFSGDRGWMPLELRRATLAYAEHLFRAPGRPMITAKVDRVYRRTDGRLVLVELKTRCINRVYLSDVIELSAQRVAISGQTGESVATYAYVVVQRGSGKRTGHKVNLLGSAEVYLLVQRREAILAGVVRPQLACVPGLCEKCLFEKRCPSAR